MPGCTARAPSMNPETSAVRSAHRSRFVRSVDVEFAGTRWRVLPQFAVFWPAQRWLVVADVHVGKAAVFRARGVPVPQGTTVANLARLTHLIEATKPQRLVFLGDLLHAREAYNAETIGHFTRWREGHRALEMTLVEGNHDRNAGALPAELCVELVAAPWRIDGVALCHHPQRVDGAGVIAGHLHPCVRLYGAANDSLRLPCFWLRDSLLTLPAFGEFTGGAPIEREAGDRVIAIAEERLIEIPAFGLRAG